ncbi:hypothetical protein PM082_011057 [Marasmius tenuissimus]|nr:hypothetical protein PM082_011057 [Marasmius tenuissimus]
MRRGILKRLSEVFADEFGVPQRTNMKIVAEELEGRQDVEMAHNGADDVYYLKFPQVAVDELYTSLFPYCHRS